MGNGAVFTAENIGRAVGHDLVGQGRVGLSLVGQGRVGLVLVRFFLVGLGRIWHSHF